VITVTARDAAGDPIPRAKVTVRLVAGPRPTDPGFAIDDNHTSVTGSEHLTNQAGNLELDLASTDDGEMDPPGCFYLITAAGAKRTIEVPATGDYDWGDPDIALIDPASPEAAHGVPPNGTTGQHLAKASDTSYDLEWVDDTGGGGGGQPLDSDLTAIAALTTTSFGRNLLTLADAAAGRTSFGLGTAATSASTSFDAAGSAAAAQAASQPLDSDLTAIAALTTTSYGRALLALADAAAARTALALGDVATRTVGTSAGQVRDAANAAYTDTRTPTDGTVTTAKIAAGAVTADKLAVPGWQVIHDRTLGSTSSSESFALTGTQWRVRILGRVSATGSGSVTLRATLNNDTSSLYSSAGGALAASFDLSNMAASQTNTNRPTAIDFHLSSHPGQWALGYSIPLVMASTAALSPGSAAPRPVVWESTALPVSIELFPASSTFETGCRFIIEAMA
jgi:hypothetical protein